MEEMNMDELIRHSRELRNKFLADPYRPVYHFVVPEGLARPFDPNGCIYWKAKYHLFYIFQDSSLPHGGHCWGHVSSIDLVHWRHHPTGLAPRPGDPDRGIFSGNAFVNKRGEATILYHGVGVGNCIATSAEDDLVNWAKLPANPIIPSPKEGDPEFGKYRSWDPHGWLEGDTYYAIFGGKRPSIFRAKELDQWEYVGDLLAHAAPGVDINEDVSCPDLFKLGDKYVLVCISHRLGCRYYVGEWKNEQFYPESHEQMSWADNAFFAPESLLDDRGRRILWAWIFDGRGEETVRASGWSGTMSLPRVLWLGEDKKLRVRPPEELEMLRYNPKKMENLTVESDSELPLKGVAGNSLELSIEMVPDDAEQFGAKVCCSPDGAEQTAVFYDAAEKKLKIDTTKSSLGEGPKSVEGGPFELKPDESLKLRIFVDKSVVEVFANDRQAVMRRVYPTRGDSHGIVLFSHGGVTEVKSIEAWAMAPANAW
jgi:beta-fructofuranosidase